MFPKQIKGFIGVHFIFSWSGRPKWKTYNFSLFSINITSAKNIEKVNSDQFDHISWSTVLISSPDMTSSIDLAYPEREFRPIGNKKMISWSDQLNQSKPCAATTKMKGGYDQNFPRVNVHNYCTTKNNLSDHFLLVSKHFSEQGASHLNFLQPTSKIDNTT